MLRLKPFLLAFSLSPLFLATFQLPSNAQILFPSKGTAGSASGAGTTGSSSSVFSIPLVIINLPGPAQSSLNTVAAEIIANGLRTPFGQILLSVLTGPAMSRDVAGNAIASLTPISTAISGISNPRVGTTTVSLANGGKAVITTVGSGATARVSATVTIPSTTPNGVPTTFTISPAAGTINPQAALATSIAVLGAGGTLAQAQVAGAIAGTGANQDAIIRLVQALSRLFAPRVASLPIAIPNLNALREKSINSDKGLALLAQVASGVQVDANQLNEAILAYNEVIDTSRPAAVAALSKSEEFTLIGQTLRKLRVAIR